MEERLSLISRAIQAILLPSEGCNRRSARSLDCKIPLKNQSNFNLAVELRAIREGLSMAINCNITKLEIETDAQAAVNLPLDYHTANQPFNPLIDYRRFLMDKLYEKKIRHMYIERQTNVPIPWRMFPFLLERVLSFMFQFRYVFVIS